MNTQSEFASDRLRSLAAQMAIFEASKSVADTGPGRRTEGGKFEKLALTFWDAVGEVAETRGAMRSQTCLGSRGYSKLWVGDRSLYIPSARGGDSGGGAKRWLRREYRVSELVAVFPGEAEAVARYAPTSGPFAGAAYPKMFAEMDTEFDDVIVLEEGGVLKEKILLEYKTAKASEGKRIDGNAHERLSFQMMQYLEISTRYPRCSFVVVANSAFERYRNKYHVSFHAQADRLSCFKWFTMRHVCSPDKYIALAEGLLGWLRTGVHEDAGGLP